MGGYPNSAGDGVPGHQSGTHKNERVGGVGTGGDGGDNDTAVTKFHGPVIDRKLDHPLVNRYATLDPLGQAARFVDKGGDPGCVGIAFVFTADDVGEAFF